MSDTTEQECACCGFDTDCIDGLCQSCNDFNYKLEKLHKKVVVELQAENERLKELVKIKNEVLAAYRSNRNVPEKVWSRFEKLRELDTALKG